MKQLEEMQSKIENFFLQSRLITFKKGNIILRSEENPSSVFYLKNGFVRMYSISEVGKELTLNIFKPGSFFPMTWVIAQIPNYYFFEAMTESKISTVANDRFLSFLKKEPSILYDLTKRILVGLGGLLIRMEYLLSGNAYHKIAATLLLLARRFGEKKINGDVEIQLPLTHQEIAKLAGIARESTSLEMEKLTKSGFVFSHKRHLIIKDLEKLKTESLIYFEEKPLPYTF